jgi:phosphoribosylformylglycinamidine synthase
MAQARFDNYKTKRYTFPTHFTGKPVIDASKPRPKAAIIREKEVTRTRNGKCHVSRF